VVESLAPGRAASEKIPRELDSIANARAVRSPAIFLLAGRDEVVSPRFQELVVNAYCGRKAGHPVVQGDAQFSAPTDALTKLREGLNWLLTHR
jgi:hypothetical protein